MSSKSQKPARSNESKKRGKLQKKPMKLTSFFSTPGDTKIQDGPRLQHRHVAEEDSSSASSNSTVGSVIPNYHLNDNTLSPPDSPTTRSPAKYKKARQSDPNLEESDMEGDSEPEPPALSLLEQFPSSSQPVSVADMKSMLIALRDSMQLDLAKSLKPIKHDIQELQHRVVQSEHRLEDNYTAHNELVDAFLTQQEDIRRLSAKLSDIEDRSRRHNIKFRGIAETVTNLDLQSYLKSLLLKLLPGVKDSDLLLDRAHRLPKPAYLPTTTPRDVLARIHYYHIKEAAMKAIRTTPILEGQFAGITMFTDLSQATIMHRRNLTTITKALRNHEIRYQWGTPSKLIVTYKEKQVTILSLEAGLRYLKEWGIVPDTSVPERNNTSPHKLHSEWSK